MDAAHNVAGVLARPFDMAAFNVAINQLNDVKTHALDAVRRGILSSNLRARYPPVGRRRATIGDT